MKPKPQDVNIYQITASHGRVFGLGDDGNVYWWDDTDASWVLNLRRSSLETISVTITLRGDAEVPAQHDDPQAVS